MRPTDSMGELGFGPTEYETVEKFFGAGRTSPWSDHLTDAIMDWMDSLVVDYLKFRRDPTLLESKIPELSALLDQIALERYESLRAAAQDIHDNPPYRAADRWPRAELPIIETVIKWAFGTQPTTRSNMATPKNDP